MDATNYIAKLHELAQKNRWLLKFEDVDYVGPDHLRTFTVRAVVDGKAYANGVGKNKKEARQMASKNALEKEAAPYSVPLSPVQSTGITRFNYMCWLNEYGQKNKFLVRAVESVTANSVNASQCCRFVVGDKEYPAAYGTTKKEAKEEAAKLVYYAIFGNETAQEDDKQGVSEIIRSITTEDEGFADTNFIGILNHYCQKKNLLHDFVFEKRTGPPHDPQFFFKVVIDKKDYPLAEGKSVKIAKQKAAQMAYSTLQEQSDWDSKVHTGKVLFISFKYKHITITKDNKYAVNPDVKPKIKFVSDYDSIEALGKGAFGTVFKARQKLLEKYFAIKIIRCKEKTLREVKALSDLSHVNIVRYYTCWMEDTAYQWDSSIDSYSSSQSTGNQSEKYLYVEMELCDTKTLRVWIDEKNTQNVKKSRRDPRRREESLKIAQQLVTGVEYIHSLALIHRDLKPANVLFGRDGNVKIGDFGLVTAESTDEENVIERTVYKGTPSYMAPEQMNRKTYDRKVDIFALGLIYFELLWNIVTGQERQAIWDELKAQKLPEDFTRYFQQEGQIIKSMLSGQPQDRPEAKKVMQELEECSQLLTMFKSMRTV
uniref:non-specific serine/threonine protein kinase n=1 Tax=Periophthalmus magnuspinnatus TaxID=409849 RepID=A0A3B3ZBT0_9GOBI